MHTITHLYDSYDTAMQVAHHLEQAGFARDNVSVLANHGSVPPGAGETAASMGAGAGASVGTLLGGSAGLLVGIGALAIPGVGPVVAAGWLVATLTGAGAGAGFGSLVGALAGAGVAQEQAHVYAEGVRRGGTLVSVRAGESRAAEAEAIMQGFHPVDAAERERAYAASGWAAFDEQGAGLTPAELQAERLSAYHTGV